jgi:hypothetical protein
MAGGQIETWGLCYWLFVIGDLLFEVASQLFLTKKCREATFDNKSPITNN